MFSQQVTDSLLLAIAGYTGRIAGVLAILLGGFWLYRWIEHLIARLVLKSELNNTLTSFVTSTSKIIWLVLVFIATLHQMGVETTSLLAVLGTAGLAVALALKDSLNNFAAGLMVLILKPFQVGDFIDVVGSVSGTVEAIQVFHTILLTPDFKVITIPNGKVYSDRIINYSRQPLRRLDLTVPIPYQDDLEQVKAVIQEILGQDNRVKQEPQPPQVLLTAFTDARVTLVVRVWVERLVLDSVQSDLLERIKLGLNAQGLFKPGA